MHADGWRAWRNAPPPHAHTCCGCLPSNLQAAASKEAAARATTVSSVRVPSLLRSASSAAASGMTAPASVLPVQSEHSPAGTPKSSSSRSGEQLDGRQAVERGLRDRPHLQRPRICLHASAISTVAIPCCSPAPQFCAAALPCSCALQPSQHPLPLPPALSDHDLERQLHGSSTASRRTSSLLRLGMLMAVTMTLHNVSDPSAWEARQPSQQC